MARVGRRVEAQRAARARRRRSRPRSRRASACTRRRRRRARCRGARRRAPARAPGARDAARAPIPPRRRARGRRRRRAGRSCRSRRRAGCRRARRPQRSKARSTQASGSTKVARSASRPSRASSSSTRSAGTRTCSAKPPGVQARRLEALAQRLVAAPAAPALAARRVVVHDDAVAHRDARDLRADRGHLARQLVAEDGRHLARDPRLEDVRAADAAGQHAADDVAGAGLGVRRLLDAHLARGERARDPHASSAAIERGVGRRARRRARSRAR